MKVSKEAPHKARIYWQKAQRFARTARSSLDAGEWDPAVSCAVNAVINLTDALCVQYAGERSASENHGEAVRLLSGQTGLDARTRDAVGKRLAALLSMKGLAQYEGELASAGDAKAAVKEMDRALAAAAGVAREHRWD